MALEWARVAGDGEAIAEHGYRSDHNSGPYLAVMAAAVRLARQDRSNPLYSADALAFLESDMVALFADCLGVDERIFISG